MVRTENSINPLTADVQIVALLNLAVPSPIFRDTDPIFVGILACSIDLIFLASCRERERVSGREGVRKKRSRA